MRSILNAAQRVIETEGWGSTTTNRIAAEAKVSPGSLYQYFRSRDDIAAALIRGAAQRLSDTHSVTHDALATVPESWADAVEAVVDPLIVFHLENPWFPILLRYLDSSSPALQTVLDLENQLVDAVAALLHRAGLPQSHDHARALLLVFRGFTAFSAPDDRDSDMARMKEVMTSYLRSVVSRHTG